MTSPGNHILPHYDAALNAIRLRVNAICRFSPSAPPYSPSSIRWDAT